MKSLFLTLFAIALSTQAFAFSVTFDRCAAYKGDGYPYMDDTSAYRRDDRMYAECTRYYEEHYSVFEKNYRSYICHDVASMTVYPLDVKVQSGKLLVRKSFAWVTPQYEVFEEPKGAILGHTKANGEFDLIATCELSK